MGYRGVFFEAVKTAESYLNVQQYNKRDTHV